MAVLHIINIEKDEYLNKYSGRLSAHIMNELLYLSKYEKFFIDIKNKAKRGDLIVDKDCINNRNYGIGIIDIIDNKIIIKPLDDNDAYEGYPYVPIEFLDLIINNSLYYYEHIAMHDPDLDEYSINLENLNEKDLVQHEQYLLIKNTKCLLDNNGKSFADIKQILIKNITYNSNVFIQSKHLNDYLLLTF